MKRRKDKKKERGITLIALIITIIVMLILVGITVNVALNEGLFSTAKQATRQTQIAEVREMVVMDILTWQMNNKASLTTEGLKEILDSYFEDVPTPLPEDLNVILRLKKEYGGHKNIPLSEIYRELMGIYLDKKEIKMEMELGKTAEEEITANIIQLEGNITWELRDKGIVEIDKEEGESIKVKAVGEGKTQLISRCDNYEAKCEIEVKKSLRGMFVEYDVEYTDAIHPDYSYNKNNGWRILEYEDNEDGTYSNVKLISTGMPATVFWQWSYVNKSKILSNLGGKEKILDFLKVLDLDASVLDAASNNAPMLTSANWYYLFENIDFGKNEERHSFNTIKTAGIQYNNENKTSVTGGQLFNLYKDNATVRILTLREMNKSLKRKDLNSQNKISEQEDYIGLYRLDQLANIKEIDSSYSYNDTDRFWLASPPPPYPVDAYTISYITCSGDVRSKNYLGLGLRPIIVFSSDIKLQDTNSDGVLEIELVQ